MRKSWRWFSLTLVAALCACDDESSDDDKDYKSKLLVMTEVCADEHALLWLGDDRVYDGDAAGLVGTPVPVPSGKSQVTLWIDGQLVDQSTIDVGNGKTATLTVERDVTCPLDAGGEEPPVPDGGVTPDGGQPDGGDLGDGGVVEACSEADDTREKARQLALGDTADALCSIVDVDFFKFKVGEDHALTLRLATTEESGLEGELQLLDAEGAQLDVQRQNANGKDAVVKAVLFAGTYYVRVANILDEVEVAPDASAPTGEYTLSLALASAKETENEAVAGTFHGATNDPEVPGLEGTFVAVGTHDAEGKALRSVVQVRITLPGAEPADFALNPKDQGGLLRVVFFDGTAPVAKQIKRPGLTRLPFADWLTRKIVVREGPVLKEAVTGEVSIEFASGEVVKRKVDKTKLLATPTVKTAVASGDPTTLAVEITRPAKATKVLAEAHGAVNAARGSASPETAKFDLELDGKLEDDEPFVVRVRAADKGLLSLPLPTETNLSEFVYYSDESASQE